jgi:Mg2+ and Co2+ transporter CorA
MERYIHNEFNIFVSQNYLLTFRYYNSSDIRRLREKYEEKIAEKDGTSTGFLLYELLEYMLDKVMKMLERFGKDLRLLEQDLFNQNGAKTIE